MSAAYLRPIRQSGARVSVNVIKLIATLQPKVGIAQW